MSFPGQIKAGLGILALVTWTLSASGNPFSRAYVLALENITMTGDLLLPCPLQTLALDEPTGVEIWLEHKLETLDYGQARSRFVLHPFETGVFPRGPGVLAWLRPGGGEVLFTDQQDTTALPPRWPQSWSSQSTSRPLRCYQAEGVELWISATGGQVICDDGWELCHQHGELAAIRSPTGVMWRIAASGRRVLSVMRGTEQVAAIQWRSDLTPDTLLAGGELFRFSRGPGSSLAEVRGAAGRLYGFSYDDRNLLCRMAWPSGPDVEVDWNRVRDFTRGDSLYVLLFTVARVGPLRYEYENRQGVISLRTFSGAKPRDVLTVVTRYGRIVSVR